MKRTSQSWLSKNWKLLVNLVTLLALAGLVYALRHQLVDTFKNFAHVHASLLLLLIPIELLNYHAQAKLTQGLFRVVGNKLPYRFLYRAMIELNFVNHVFPSGGVTGLSYFSLRLRNGEDISGAKASLIHVLKLGLTLLSFELLIVFGLVALSVMGRVSNLTVLVAAVLSTLLLVGTVGFAYVVGSKRRINSFFAGLTRGLNRFIAVFRRGQPETIDVNNVKDIFDDFHENYREIRKHYKELKAPFWWSLLANVTEVSAIYAVYLAFGEPVNIGAVIMAYAVANFAGLVSVLPGGVGIYEALMTGVLATAGVPAALSLPVTVMYRVVNTSIQIPPGYYFYQKTLRQDGISAKPAPELRNA